MATMRDVAAMLNALLQQQRLGSDYDSLYFGVQDIRDYALDAMVGGGMQAYRRQPFTPPDLTPSKPKRKVSAYHKRLGREIKRLRKRHLLKTGKWRKGWSQKKMMKAAHKAAKR